MIICTIIINQTPGGPVAVAITYDREGVSEAERLASTSLNDALQKWGESMLKPGDVMLEGEKVQGHARRLIQQIMDKDPH